MNSSFYVTAKAIQLCLTPLGDIEVLENAQTCSLTLDYTQYSIMSAGLVYNHLLQRRRHLLVVSETNVLRSEPIACLFGRDVSPTVPPAFPLDT
ncbi:hypothetical protein E2C01_101271 [Portunus trituberculatus]|uniref:Uncharacterized protein n=1 Tax=Portunus trituberculatus TaxID=210409 RepID=A0A5B7KFE5_PORTR|nr:hypothetical protein [Portunus trituberculatus]